MTRSARALAAPWLFLAVTACVFVNGLFGPLQFDDHFLVTDPSNRSWDRWALALADPVRPLLKASYVASHQLGDLLGGEAIGHHVVNLLIHLVAVALAWNLARRLFDAWFPAPYPRRWLATLSILPLALHPLATEAVTYVSGRSVTLGTGFMLASVLCHLRAVESVQRAASAAWIALSMACAVAAVLTREALFVTPMLVALVEWSRSSVECTPWSFAAARRAVRLGAPLALAVLLALAWLWAGDGYVRHIEMSRLIVQGRVGEPVLLGALQYFVTRFAGLAPLSLDPGMRSYELNAVTQIIGVGALLLMTVVSWRGRATRPHIAFAFIGMIVVLAPMYLLPLRHDAVSERHFYPVLLVVGLALAGEAAMLGRRGPCARRILQMGVGVAVIVMIMGTMVRNAEYQSEISLWQSTVRASPGNARAHANLGVACLRARQWDCAVRSLDRALALEPGQWDWQDYRDRAALIRQTGNPQLEPSL